MKNGLVSTIDIRPHSNSQYLATITDSSGIPITDSLGVPYSIQIGPNKTSTVAVLNDSFYTFEPSVYVGDTYSIGIVDVSNTIDSRGIVTVTATGGELWIRFSIYGSTDGDYGICYAPGVDGSVVKFDGAFCVGRHSISLGGGGSAGFKTAGFNIKLVKY